MKNRWIVFCICIYFLFSGFSFAGDLPRFYGIYVMQNGNYVEVPRVINEHYNYNFIERPIGQDFNVRSFIDRSSFVQADAKDFNKDGFLVIQDEAWSDFVLKRVPHEGSFNNNEQAQKVTTNIDYSGTMMGMAFSHQGLDQSIEPQDYCELRKAKIGENAFIYVPSKNVVPGLYLIDYKKNGSGFSGWNPVVVQ